MSVDSFTINHCLTFNSRIKPSKEMIAALKVLNDHLQKSPEPNEVEIRNAREVASCEWFQISSTESATSDNVEDYLDYFEEQSWDLLTYMVNLADKNGNTAMHYAVSHGNFDVVSILLDSKVGRHETGQPKIFSQRFILGDQHQSDQQRRLHVRHVGVISEASR